MRPSHKTVKKSLIKKIYRDVLLVQILGLISSYISYMVDSAVIGRFLGDAALSAAGFLNPVVSMCFALTGLFSTGIGVRVAALFCSGDLKETRKQFTKYFLSGLAAVAMISFLWIALAKPFAGILGASSASEEIFDMTVSYLRIYLLANPIWFMLNVSIGVLELDGDRVISMEEKPEKPKTHYSCPPFYFYKAADLSRIDEALTDGCEYDAPGSFPAWLCLKSEINSFEMPGPRYDIGNLESYEAVKKIFTK